MRKFDFKNFLYLSIFWFALEFCWQGLITIVFPSRILSFVPKTSKGHYLALIMSMGALVSMLGQPICGTLSDYSTHTKGRRRPFFAVGTILLIFGLFLLAFSSSFLFFLLSVIIIFTASDFTQAPYQGLIPDLIPSSQRGEASGFMTLATLLGALFGPLVAGFLLGARKLTEAIMIIILVLALSSIITIIKVKERRRFIKFIPLKEKFRRAFQFKIKNYPQFYWLQLSRFCMLLALTTILLYFLYFLKDVIHVSNPEKSTGIVMGVAITSAIIPSLPVAAFSDRIGRKFLLFLAGFLGCLTVIPLMFAQSFAQVLAIAAFFGFSFGSFSGVQWALSIDIIPREEPAKFLGYTQFSTSAAQIFAPMIAGPIIDFFSATRLAYQIIYGLSLIYMILGLTFLAKIKEPKR